jgi:hypothetical protein
MHQHAIGPDHVGGALYISLHVRTWLLQAGYVDITGRIWGTRDSLRQPDIFTTLLQKEAEEGLQLQSHASASRTTEYARRSHSCGRRRSRPEPYSFHNIVLKVIESQFESKDQRGSRT